MLYFLLVFAVIFVVVLAFSSNERETRVRTINPRTGRERIEVHESVSPSAAQTAARFVVMLVIWLVILGGLVLFFLL